MVIFSYDVDGMQRLLGALEAFCQSSGLTVNVDKTKLMVVRTIQPQGEHVQFVQSVKYLGYRCTCHK